MPESDLPLFHPTKPLYWQYLKSGLVTVNGVEKRKTALLLLGLTLIFISLIFSLHRLLSVVKPTPKVLGETTSQPTPTFIPTPQPITPSPTSVPPILVFSATVSAKPAVLATPNLYLADVLVDALKLPLIIGRPFPIKRILYDAWSTPSLSLLQQNPFNGHYFIVLSAPALIPHQAKSAYISVTTQPLSETWLPYFTDPTYCQTDIDCALRVSQCQENAFNRFDLFMDVSSCVATVPPISPIPEYSVVDGCLTIPQYTAPVCLNNHCQTHQENQCIGAGP